MVRLNLNPNATNTVSIQEVNTEAFQLYPLAPNPAAETTRLQYRLDQAATVTMEVYDMTGKLVQHLNRGTQGAGYHSITLDVSAFDAGVYTTMLNVNGARATERLLVD
ncbi:MAG: T9SS type A sorting domain-containing protein, partial [Flavobacteriales bacterium]